MKYEQALKIAKIALSELVLGGGKYRPDTVYVAAQAASACTEKEAAITAIERAFQSCRISINPRWDGSIA